MILFLGLLLAMSADLAHAARNGAVDADETELRVAPQEKAPILRKLVRGTRVEASNEPIEGYHKVRLQDGQIGFVNSKDLFLAPVPRGEGGVIAAILRGPKPNDPDSVKTASIRLGSGVGFGHFGAVNTLIGFDRFSNPLSFSAEVAWKLTPAVMLLVGGDYSMHSLTLSGTVSKSTTTVTRTYAFGESAIVARAGAAWLLVNEEHWLIDVALMGALSPAVTITAQLTAAEATDVSTASPNTTTLSALGFGAVTRLLIERRIWKGLGATVESGFRYITTTATQPSSSPNGSDLFKQNNAYVPVALQLVGFYVQGGLSWAF